jgi:hypothetical protein
MGDEYETTREEPGVLEKILPRLVPDLAFFGDQVTRIITHSIIASSFTRKFDSEFLLAETQKYAGTDHHGMGRIPWEFPIQDST